MARIIAIDYGRVKSGLAVTDELQLIANGLKTVPTKGLVGFLEDYCKREDVEGFVIGEPKQMDYTDSESIKYIKPFMGRLKKMCPGKAIYRMDERFTSKMAFQTMIDSGIGKKARRNKKLVDTISATLILQSFLMMKENNLI
ncbi:MAG: Holliday junction resolvase RuvX [Bacteroidota bacterium]|nr:Holliday junction resolvase RuvX [Bacteroidota bacterium]